MTAPRTAGSPVLPMTEDEVREGRRRHDEQAAIRSGGPCLVCGFAGLNVVHDPPAYREWSVEHVYCYDYYADAEVGYHEYVPGARPAERPYFRPTGRIPTIRPRGDTGWRRP